ncbi:hypothetical protein ABBQ38_014700 [Trebouxia sp. C0009 RCD-2024]
MFIEWPMAGATGAHCAGAEPGQDGAKQILRGTSHAERPDSLPARLGSDSDRCTTRAPCLFQSERCQL